MCRLSQWCSNWASPFLTVRGHSQYHTWEVAAGKGVEGHPFASEDDRQVAQGCCCSCNSVGVDTSTGQRAWVPCIKVMLWENWYKVACSQLDKTQCVSWYGWFRKAVTHKESLLCRSLFNGAVREPTMHCSSRSCRKSLEGSVQLAGCR